MPGVPKLGSSNVLFRCLLLILATAGDYHGTLPGGQHAKTTKEKAHAEAEYERKSTITSR